MGRFEKELESKVTDIQRIPVGKLHELEIKR